MNNTDNAGIGGVSSDCYYLSQISSRGLGYSVPSIFLQYSLISLSSRLLHFLLKPVGQPLVVAQILGGVILGPSLLGRNASFLEIVFPVKSLLVLDTISLFGLMLFVFLIAVKTDASIITRCGKKALAVGVLGFFVPLALAGLVAVLLDTFLSLDHDIARALPLIVPLLSMTAFPVITCFLDELNILNSEIGRLASSSSIICDVCLWSVTCITFAADIARNNPFIVTIEFFVLVGLFIAILMLVIRPAALWVVRHTPETRPVRETYIFLALVILMASGFAGEVLGIHATTACLVLGLIVPNGPPLGEALAETLDCFVSLMLLPLFFSVSGLNVDVFCVQNLKNAGVLQLLVVIAFVGKVMGSMLPLIVCRMPFWDALSLGLIMNSKGIVEVAILNDFKNRDFVSEEVYTIMIVSVVTITGIISPIVKLLYDPSKRFVAYKRRTIFHSRGTNDLRVLACIHQQEDVHSIISLLQVSNTTKNSPIDLVVLHLIKLTGRSSSLLVPHKQPDKPPRKPTQSERIFNAFKKLEEQNLGLFNVQCYKGIAPYMTMHNDVCALALEKRTVFVILPFHKKSAFGESLSSHSYRHLNKSVLDKAPCSVGILIDHRCFKFKSPSMVFEHSSFRVVVLFFGGADDREALAYAQRISEHSSVWLSLLRFVSAGPAEIVAGTERSKRLDAEVLGEFKFKTQNTEEILVYKENVVSSGMDVVAVARLVVNAYDLIMVGRRHGGSPIMVELGKWNELGDLGAIGELLTASEIMGKASVLVVQQQTKLWGLKDPEESTHLRRVKL